MEVVVRYRVRWAGSLVLRRRMVLMAGMASSMAGTRGDTHPRRRRGMEGIRLRKGTEGTRRNMVGITLRSREGIIRRSNSMGVMVAGMEVMEAGLLAGRRSRAEAGWAWRWEARRWVWVPGWLVVR